MGPLNLVVLAALSQDAYGGAFTIARCQKPEQIKNVLIKGLYGVNLKVSAAIENVIARKITCTVTDQPVHVHVYRSVGKFRVQDREFMVIEIRVPTDPTTWYTVISASNNEESRA